MIKIICWCIGFFDLGVAFAHHSGSFGVAKNTTEAIWYLALAIFLMS